MTNSKRRTGKKNGTKRDRKQGIRFYQNERFRYGLGVLFLILAAYLIIASISYLFYGAADQSKLDLNWSELIFNSGVKVGNKAGKTGALLSEIIINRGFGVASFLFIYMMVVTGVHILGQKIVRLGKTYFLGTCIILWISLALGLLFTGDESGHYTFLGGHYGLVISGWLKSLIGTAGTVLFLLLSGFIILIGSSRNSASWLKRLFGSIHKPHKAISEEEIRSEDDVVREESVSKVIEEDDVVQAVFENEEEDFSEERKGKVDDRNEKESQPEEEEDLELTIEERPKDEEGEYDTRKMEDYDPTLELSEYRLPPIDLLVDHDSGNAEVSNEELISNKNKIVETLRQYKIEITKIRATIGPAITLYEIVPAPGIRIAKIKNLEDDIALSLAAMGIRIIAPIPGRGTIGIEVPNQNPEIVSMRSIINSKRFQEFDADLPVVIGKTISNEPYVFDLVKMPHILVAGATGQGKSVGLNVIISSLLYKKHPSELKFIFFDPKKVELSLYSSIEKFYLAKLQGDDEAIITDLHKVKNVLNSLNAEMDLRYNLLKKGHARNLKEYNKKFISRRLNPEKGHRFMPYIVVVIDEFADMIMTAGKEIELPIARIAQLARAVGIHMIIATQRPSTNIITGVIKANFPVRIAFKVASMIDSRTILDTPGANQLVGKGDMLIASGSDLTRVQCGFMDTPEVEELCKYISEQKGFPEAYYLPEYEDVEGDDFEADLSNLDELFEDAARLIVLNQMGSTSMIQRKFSIGYNRAGRIMDQMEAAGIVGPSEGSKARQVLIADEYSLEQLLNSLN